MRAPVTLVYRGFAKPQFETSLIVQKGLHVNRPSTIFIYVNLFIYLFITLFNLFLFSSIIVALCSGVLYSYTVTFRKESEQRILHPVRDS